MRKINYSAVVLFWFFLTAGITANAQKDSKKFSFGFGFEAGTPVGLAKTSYRFTGGLGLRFSYHVGPGFATFSAGAIAFVPKSGLGKSTKASLQIPVKVGYKYVFYKPFFVMAEMGYSSFKVYYAGVDGNLASNSTGGFTYAPTVGVNFDAFEVGIKYEGTSLTGGALSNIGLRLGFNF